MSAEIKSLFLLNPDITFLNHGSFGACPRPVFAAYQSWQRQLEHQPVEFLDRRMISLMTAARESLAAYLGCQPDEVVYFPNPTTAFNMVARSLDLSPTDEVLTTDHEYGAMERTWRFICQRTGARYVRHPVPLPVTNADEFVNSFWAGVTPNTKVIFISHITSPTALIFPIEEICQRAREAGLLCIVDGAHSPGQISLDLSSLGADIYLGACHKWMCAPKGSSFLYARREVGEWLQPLVVSWGYAADQGFGSGIRFIDYHEWQGTRDISAFLAVPAAIDFLEEHRWDAVRDRCHHLARTARQRINGLTGFSPISADTSKWFGQMFSAQLPELDVGQLKTRLNDTYKIEVPVFLWNGAPYIRVSIQGYNTQADVDALLRALTDLLP